MQNNYVINNQFPKLLKIRTIGYTAGKSVLDCDL